MKPCDFRKEVSLSHWCNRNRMHLEKALSCHFRVSFRYLREFYIFIAPPHLPRFSLPISFQSFHLFIEYDLVTTVRLDLMIWGRRLCLHQNHSIFLLCTLSLLKAQFDTWPATLDLDQERHCPWIPATYRLRFSHWMVCTLFGQTWTQKTSRLGNHFYDF